jgi:urease accessory protein
MLVNICGMRKRFCEAFSPVQRSEPFFSSSLYRLLSSWDLHLGLLFLFRHPRKTSQTSILSSARGTEVLSCCLYSSQKHEHGSFGELLDRVDRHLIQAYLVLTWVTIHFRSFVHVMKAGQGQVNVECFAGTATCSELSSTYPLKLLASRNPSPDVAVVYSLSYGGGLVGGDMIDLTVRLGPESTLVALTQGSTKVFKTRPARPCHNPEATTRQNLTCILSPSSFLLLLPDPVTCFRSASYTQIQTFHLASGSSLVLLDWLTSGRESSGEIWDFEHYHSTNEIWIDSTRIARDAVTLDQNHFNPAPHLPKRTLADRLHPYSCYATLILIGPRTKSVIDDLRAAYAEITVYQRNTPEGLIWSLSPVADSGDSGWVVRVAATESEAVRDWLGNSLRSLVNVLGVDLHKRTFN